MRKTIRFILSLTLALVLCLPALSGTGANAEDTSTAEPTAATTAEDTADPSADPAESAESTSTPEETITPEADTEQSSDSPVISKIKKIMRAATATATTATLSKDFKSLDSFSGNAVSFQKGSGADYESNKSSAVEIQDSSSSEKIYMWHDSSNNYYWYSPATTVYLPTDSSSLFDSCTKLTKVDVTGLDSSNVTTMEAMFSDDDSLKTIIGIGDWDTSNVTRFIQMFNDCEELTALDLSKWDVSSGTYFTAMFSECHKLSTMDLRNWKPKKAQFMAYMFMDCMNLKTVQIGNMDNWSADYLKSTNGMFAGCSALTYLNLNGLRTNIGTLTDTSNMFAECSSLKYLDICHLNTTGDVSYMFHNCTALKRIRLGGTFVPNVNGTATTNLDMVSLKGFKRVEDYFENVVTDSTTYDLTTLSAKTTVLGGTWVKHTSSATLLNGFINLDSFKDNAVSFKKGKRDSNDYDGTSYIENISSAVEIQDSSSEFPIFMWHDSSNNYYWWSEADVNYFPSNSVALFADCKALSKAYLDDWDISKATNMGQMFEDDQKLSAINGIADWDTTNVTNMARMFYGCKALESLDVSKWNVSNVTNLGGTFRECTGLTSLDVSKWDTSKNTVLASTFAGCSSLSSLDISGWNTANVVYMNSTFAQCSSLTSLNTSNWDTSKCIQMDSMFSGCSKLQSVDVSKWQTSKVKAMGGMFSGCFELTSLDLSGFDTSLAGITAMFYGDSKLQKLVFGSKFTKKPNNLSVEGVADTITLNGWIRTLDADGKSVTDRTRYDLTTLDQTTTPVLAGTWVKPTTAVVEINSFDDGNSYLFGPIGDTGWHFCSYKVTDSSSNVVQSLATGGQPALVELSPGTYTLSETKTPDGWMPHKDVTITVGNDLSVTASETLIVDSTVKSDGADAKLNLYHFKSGTVLPATGGSGTLLLTILGCLGAFTGAMFAAKHH